ncbi:hypothetical protein [Amycolatopsis tucumanensis]|uniref:hypothetical protein n=1 Tax=Amycolatopsis tucumanensis TaxID=401106 RepID=UPI0031E91735
MPEVGLFATLARLEPLDWTEGFDALYEVEFDGAGGFVVRPGPGRPAAPGG